MVTISKLYVSIVRQKKIEKKTWDDPLKKTFSYFFPVIQTYP